MTKAACVKASLIAILFLGRGSLAQDSKTPTAPQVGGAAEAVKSVETGKVPESLIEAIDTATIDDLRIAVDRAQNSLSRKGQEALMDRARVDHALTKAESIVRTLKRDPSINEAALALESPAARAALLLLVEMAPDKMSEAFQEFIKTNRINGAALRKLAKLRDAESSISKAKALRQKIEDSLNRASFPSDPSSDPNSVDRLGKQLDEIATRYGGEGSGTSDGPAASTSPDDVKALILVLIEAAK